MVLRLTGGDDVTVCNNVVAELANGSQSLQLARWTCRMVETKIFVLA